MASPASLATRIALTAAGFTVVGLLAAGFVLLGIFRDHAEEMFDATIEHDLDEIAGWLTLDGATGDWLAERLGRRGYDAPGSAWAWQVVAENGGVVAQSDSLAPGILLAAPTGAVADFTGPDDQPLRGAARPIGQRGDILHVAGPRGGVDKTVAAFAATGVATLSAFAAGLVALIFLQSRIALRPLRRLARDIEAMRTGLPCPASESWPRELAPVVDEICALERHNADLAERARQQAGNLAHGLKTPLSVAQNLAEELPDEPRSALLTQFARMEQAIRRSLAGTQSGGKLHEHADLRETTMGILVAIAPLLERHGISADTDIGPCVFAGPAGDLEEILGNLIENAARWARSRIEVSAHEEDGALVIGIRDDGPGIPAEMRDRVLGRGFRIDETTPGHGIGLAIVADLVEIHGGSIALDRAEAGGLAVRLRLPGFCGSRPARSG